MVQFGYVQCGCCGRLYREDGSEDDMYNTEHPTIDGKVTPVFYDEETGKYNG